MKITFCGESSLKMSGIRMVLVNLSQSLKKYTDVEDKTFLISDPKNFSETFRFLRHYAYEMFVKTPRLKAETGNVFISAHSISISPKVIAYFLKAPKAVIVHDMFYLDMHKLEYKSSITKFATFMVNVPFWKSSLERYDILFAISEKTKRDMVANGLNPNKIVVSPIGISNEYFRPAQNNMSPETYDYVFVLGTEMERKNMKGIIACFNILKKERPNLKLIKSGAGVFRTHRENTLKMIQEINPSLLSDIIFIDDQLSMDDIRRYYAHSKFLLYPSHKEGFGLPIVEAQASGTPVITTNAEPMSELVPYKELLVDSNNPEDIAKKCRLLLDNEDYRQQKILEGREFAKQFTWDRTAGIIYEALSKLVQH